MKRIATFFLAAIAVAVLATMFAEPALTEKPAEKPATKPAKKPPADRVVAMYFHRTQRCPTCQMMGTYSEEAVKKGFARGIKDRTVEFHYIDFQNKKNASLTKAYRVSGPALMVAKVEKNKVVKVANLKNIWTQVRDKKAFLKYVQDNIEALRKPAPRAATKTSTSR